jgi:hypothetical protein
MLPATLKSTLSTDGSKGKLQATNQMPAARRGRQHWRQPTRHPNINMTMGALFDGFFATSVCTGWTAKKSAATAEQNWSICNGLKQKHKI